MAIRTSSLCLGMVIVTMLFASAMAQTGCTTVIIGLAPCLNFITGNSTSPSSSCCSQLASVVKSQPRCLCSVLNGGGASLGISINQTQALALPGACKVQTPPVSQCNAANGPAPAPNASPKDVPADAPAEKTPSTAPATPANNIPSGSGSKTTPNTGGPVSDGIVTKTSLHLGFFLLLIVSCVSSV
ncbi:hypothetical protein ACHQM5_014734 [Ranunculus cassubicifolius]